MTDSPGNVGPPEQEKSADGTAVAPVAPKEIVLFFFDVLGFAERVAELGLPQILKQYQSLLDMVRARAGGRVVVTARPIDETTMVPVVGYLDLHSAYFSDTIMLWAEYDDLRFEVSVDIVLDFFCDCFKNGLPLRGAVAFGEAVMDLTSGIFLGQPIIEAARAEASQRWSGCRFGPSLDDFPRLGRVDRFMPYSAHIKAGREEYLRELVLDWPRRWRSSLPQVDVHTVIDGYKRPGYEEYWETTAAFVDHSETNERWWESL